MYIICRFSLVVFNSFSLSLILVSLIIMCRQRSSLNETKLIFELRSVIRAGVLNYYIILFLTKEDERKW